MTTLEESSEIPDPVTGLTSKEKDMVQSTWRVLMKNPTQNGGLILTTYFSKHPEHLAQFPFKDVPVDELKDNRKFKAHCNSVIYSIASAIDNLEDTEVLESILLKIGKNHNLRNIPSKAFWEIKDVILEILQPTIDEATYEAWDKTLTTVMTVIGSEL